jgi:hypothetical protein
MSKVSVGKKANTTVVHEGSKVHIYLHNTKIVSFDKQDRSAILNSGGWRTVTTKRRMNEVSNEFDLGIQVFQDNFEWYVIDTKGDLLDFYDNMEVPID